MAAVATPQAAQRCDNGNVGVPGTREVSRNTDRRYSEVVKEYMKKQKLVGSVSSESVEPADVLTHLADRAGPHDDTYVSWDHPDTPRAGRSSTGPDVQSPKMYPQLTAGSGEGRVEPVQCESAKQCPGGVISEGSVSSSLQPKSGTRSYRSSADTEVFFSPFSAAFLSAKHTNPFRPSQSTSSEMVMRTFKTPPKCPSQSSSRDGSEAKSFKSGVGSDSSCTKDSNRVSQSSETSKMFFGTTPNFFRCKPKDCLSVTGGAKSPGKAPAIKITSVGGSPRDFLGVTEGSSGSPGRDLCSGGPPSSKGSDLGRSATPPSPSLSRSNQTSLRASEKVTPVDTVPAAVQDPFLTHTIPTDGGEPVGHELLDSPSCRNLTINKSALLDTKRYSGDSSVYGMPHAVRPLNPVALNFENMSRRSSEDSSWRGGSVGDYQDAVGTLSYPPEEASVTQYALATPFSYSGQSMSLAVSPWRNKSKTKGVNSHKVYKRSEVRRKRLGWCLVITGLLLLVASAITIIVVEVPAHSQGLRMKPLNKTLESYMDKLGVSDKLGNPDASLHTGQPSSLMTTLGVGLNLNIGVGTDASVAGASPAVTTLERLMVPTSSSSTPDTVVVPASSSTPDTVVVPASSSSTLDTVVVPASSSSTLDTVVVPASSSSTPDTVVVPASSSSSSTPDTVVVPASSSTLDTVVVPASSSSSSSSTPDTVVVPASFTTPDTVVVPASSSSSTPDTVVVPASSSSTPDTVVVPASSSSTPDTVVVPASSSTPDTMVVPASSSTPDTVVVPASSSSSSTPDTVVVPASSSSSTPDTVVVPASSATPDTVVVPASSSSSSTPDTVVVPASSSSTPDTVVVPASSSSTPDTVVVPAFSSTPDTVVVPTSSLSPTKPFEQLEMMSSRPVYLQSGL
nr:flocculation protein FLO11-like [Procambarus clarkii]